MQFWISLFLELEILLGLAAVALSSTPNFLQNTLINLIDNAAAKISTQIVNPRLSNSKLLKELKSFESSDVSKI